MMIWVCLYFPRVTNNTVIRMTPRIMGIAGIPSVWPTDLIAAISVITVPIFATTNPEKTISEILTPQRSRIRSPRPLRVTTDKRIPISCR